ncbi:hypothetical protein [Pseudanabaena yagii]|uniref:Fimbrial protein n=1 Tax=Pseudanabaena yagii GIHE-NHR1 TaxID=2722753 RepID=A0ABX1LYE4_9CYAN|nr:hypothetical protein [Pseudanabaena yagii]NMF61235.1 hypothetical protein [Pseudanabaena yagii GIHE-NHR1]
MNKFNRILLASGLAATASLMTNSPAFAGTTATVNLSGTLVSTLSLSVDAQTSASALDLTPGRNYSDVKVAWVYGGKTNNLAGLKVLVSSTWQLTSGSNTIPITTVGDAPDSSSVATVKTATNSSVPYTLNVTKTTTSGNAPSSMVFIDYSVPLSQVPGAYTGSITFTAYDN